MRFTFSSLCATGKMLSTCKECIENFRQATFFEAWPCFAADEWGGISDFIVPLAGTSYMGGEFTLVLQHKAIGSSQFVERLKARTTSLSKKAFQLLHRKRNRRNFASKNKGLKAYHRRET